jgi:nucleoside phosphorylase
LSVKTLPSATDRVTFGVVTALPKEYAAMGAMLDDPHDVVTARGRVYCRGTVPAKGGGTHHVVMVLGDQGTASATHRATLLTEDFPEVHGVVMVGIAGAVPHPNKPEHHVRLGDIVTSGEHGVIAYDFVKEHRKFKEPRHPPRPPDAALLQAARRLSAGAIAGKAPWLAHFARASELPNSARPNSDTDTLTDTQDQDRLVAHPDDPDRKPFEPRIFSGTIACANTLLKNAEHRDQIRDDFSVRAVEMEGFGVAETAWNQGIGYFIVRGCCDYCDKHKGDAWQGYAAIAAAAYARALLGETPGFSTVQGTPTTREVRATELDELTLRTAAEALLAAGTPPTISALFPEASKSARAAIDRLGLCVRKVRQSSSESDALAIADLVATPESPRHLVVAPPGAGKTYSLWHAAREMQASGKTIPIYIAAGTAATWGDIEEHLVRVCSVDVTALLSDPRVCVLLDGWSEFTSQARPDDYPKSQRALLNARVIANGRPSANLDPRFRVWALQPLALDEVTSILRLAFAHRPLPHGPLIELLRLPLALSLYIFLGGNAVTRGELLARFHDHLSRGFPENFRGVLAGSVASASLADEHSKSRFDEGLRSRANTAGIAEPQRLLARLGTIETRASAVAPVHDLYWSWLAGIGVLAENRVEASLPFLHTREAIELALESGASPKESMVASIRDIDAILAASLSRHIGTPAEGAGAIRGTIDALLSDPRSAVRCRGILAVIKAQDDELLPRALDAVSQAHDAGIRLHGLEDAWDLDALYAQRGIVSSWLGATGTDQVVDAIAMRGDERWADWLHLMADSGKLSFSTAVAAALACQGSIPGWARAHLTQLASGNAFLLRPVAARQANVDLARWLAEHYEDCVQPNSTTFLDLNAVLVACGDDAVFARLLERFATMPESAREQLEYGIVERGDPWLGRFQTLAFGEQAPGRHHKLSQHVSKQVDEATAREWVKRGRPLEGWRVLIERLGNAIVPELVGALPESFDGEGFVPALEALKFLKDPPEDLADAIWSRMRGTLHPRTAEQIIYALAPIRGRGIPSLVGEYARNPFFMTPYHFVRFLAALGKWQSETGLSFRVRDVSGQDVDFVEWIVWRRIHSDKDDALYQSRLGVLQNVLPAALLARFEQAPELCAQLLPQVRRVGRFHKGLVEYMLGEGRLAATIPTLFADSLDTFPEDVLLQILDIPGLDFRTTVAAIAATPSPSHARAHRLIAHRALSGDFNPWLYRDVAKALRVHPRATLLGLLKEECRSADDKQMWLIREAEAASGHLMVTERGEWLG